MKHDNGKEIFQCSECGTKTMSVLNTECIVRNDSKNKKQGNHFIFQKEFKPKIKY